MGEERVLIVDKIKSFHQPLVDHLTERGHKVFQMTGAVNVEFLNTMDLIWCSWADELAVQLSQIPQLKPKLVVQCRSYEAYGPFLSQINWSAVNHLVFVADHIRDYAAEVHNISLDVPCSIMPTCIDAEKWPLKQPLDAEGANIALVGRLAEPKNIQFAVELAYLVPFAQIWLKGPVGDTRLKAFVEYHQKKMPNIHWQAPGSNITWHDGSGMWNFYNQMHYILSCSYHESTHMTLLEGMAVGLVPLVQDRPGAVWPRTYITSAGCAKMVEDLRPSAGYRDFILDNRPMARQHHAMDVILEQVL